MKLLLDTHIAVWAVAGDPRLSAAAREAIEDAANEAWVSVASLWELAIKHPLKKRRDAPPFGAFGGRNEFIAADFRILDVTSAHTLAFETVTIARADPVDRMLVAQAAHEGLRLLTADKALIGTHPCVTAA